LRLGGLRGKKSTPSVWLGGTGEFIAVGKQEQEQQEHRNRCGKRLRPRYVPELSRVACIGFIAAIMVVLLGNVVSSSFIPGKKKGVFRRSWLRVFSYV
jgi:hypothetical protein